MTRLDIPCSGMASGYCLELSFHIYSFQCNVFQHPYMDSLPFSLSSSNMLCYKDKKPLVMLPEKAGRLFHHDIKQGRRKSAMRTLSILRIYSTHLVVLAVLAVD